MPEGFNNGGNHKDKSIRAQTAVVEKQDKERLEGSIDRKKKGYDKKNKKEKKSKKDYEDEDE